MKLQVFKDGQWQYVFCRNPLTGIVTTKDRKKALDDHALAYFKKHFGNNQFRASQTNIDHI